MKKILFALSLTVSIFSSGLGVSSGQMMNTAWHTRFSQGEALYGVGFGNDSFIGVTMGGSVVSSMDGETWSVRPKVVDDWLWAVAYGNGKFAAVGTDSILTSPDGNTWQVENSSNSYPLLSVAYGNDSFVAAGTGIILQSDFLSGSCTATLSSDLKLHVPIIDFGGSYIRGDSVCGPSDDGGLLCRVLSYGESIPADYAGCRHATLTDDLKIHIPAGVYNNISYRADFEYVPSNDGEIWFRLTKAERN